MEVLGLQVPMDQRQQAARATLEIVRSGRPAPPSCDVFDASGVQIRLCNLVTSTANTLRAEDATVIEAAVVTLGWLAPPGTDSDCLKDLLLAATRAGWVPGPGHADPHVAIRRTLEAIGGPQARKALGELER